MVVHFFFQNGIGSNTRSEGFPATIKIKLNIFNIYWPLSLCEIFFFNILKFSTHCILSAFVYLFLCICVPCVCVCAQAQQTNKQMNVSKRALLCIPHFVYLLLFLSFVASFFLIHFVIYSCIFFVLYVCKCVYVYIRIRSSSVSVVNSVRHKNRMFSQLKCVCLIIQIACQN